MINEIIKEKYEEAMRNPPITIDGHIQNEMGVTTDYRGRAIYEFFQNAIDRAKRKIWIRLDTQNHRLIIANDGQPFTIVPRKNQKYSDFQSICSINTSSKDQNESIGNKGVGFKSCWEFTSHVTVCSMHAQVGWGFEFFNPLSKEKLSGFGIPEITDWLKIKDISEVVEKHDRVPSFYFPRRVEQERVEKYFKFFDTDENQPVTVIVFHLENETKESELVERIKEFADHQIFFIKQLKTLADKDVELEFSIDDEAPQRLFSSHDINEWLVVSEDFSDNSKSLDELVSLSEAASYRIEHPKVAVAFPLTDKPIDSKFYCYLPTEVECGFNVLIHADFLMDRSRKQIDFGINYNGKLLEHAAELFVQNLLKQNQLHQLEHFTKFLSPKKRIDTNSKDIDLKFKEAIWGALKKENRLTKILKKVFHKNARYRIQTYENIFEAMKAWMPPRKSGGEYAVYYNDLYSNIIHFFCHEDIYIVPIGINEKVVNVVNLPEKRVGQTYDHSLFYAPYRQDKTNYDLSLISEIPQLDISHFVPINEPYFIGSANKIVRELDAKVDFLRTLVNNVDFSTAEHIKENILLFSYQFAAVDVDKDGQNLAQFLDNTKQSNNLKYQLTQMLLPCTDSSWHIASKTYFGLDSKISKNLQQTEFKEVNLEKCSKLFKLSDDELKKVLCSFGVWGVMPLNDDMHLPWQDLESLGIDVLKVLKAEVNRAIPVWEKIEDHEKIQIRSGLVSARWYVDERKADQGMEAIFTPQEVFLFNDKINREFIGQEVKESGLEPLCNFLYIRTIEDTQDSEKLMMQLKKMSHSYDINEVHKTIYRQLTLALSKHHSKDTKLEVPILADRKGSYCYLDEEHAWFVPQEHRHFKHHFQGKGYNYAVFDNDIARRFVESIGVKVFDPVYELQFNGDKELQNHVKSVLQNDFLPVFLAIAEEVRGGALEKDMVLSRWNSLQIVYAQDVFLKISVGNDVVEPFKNEWDKDVLFLPLTKTEREKKEIVSEIAHDLETPFVNPNFSRFGHAIAEGVFRFSPLGSLFAEYISKWQMQKGTNHKLCESFLHSLGLNQSGLEQSAQFVRQKTIHPDEMSAFIEQLRKITQCDHINEENWYVSEVYNDAACTYKELEQGTDEKFKDLVRLVSPVYKNLGTLEKALSGKETYWQAIVYLKEQKKSGRSDVEHAIKKYEQIKESLLRDGNNTLSIFNFQPDNYLVKDTEFSHEFDEDEIENVKVDIVYRIDDEEIVKNQTEITGIQHTMEMLMGKSSSSLGHISNEDTFKAIDKQKRQGEAREVKLCLKNARKILSWERDVIERCVVEIKNAIKKDVDTSKKTDNDILNKYEERWDVLLEKEELKVGELTEMLQVSKVIGDGLGYDVFEPLINAEGKPEILKVEVKSSSRKRIYLSQNELERIIYFIDHEPNWRLYLGEANVTKKVKKAVEQLLVHQNYVQEKKIGHAFKHSDWILDFQ